MTRFTGWLLAGALVVSAGPVLGADLSVQISQEPANPPAPKMGDWLRFTSKIKNASRQPAEGLIAWISLVRIDPGHETPVDLEDWSAQKAVVLPSLATDEVLQTEWPMRLIASGDYRVVVSVATRTGNTLATSPFADFHVQEKPVIESLRVIPVAATVPLLIGGLWGWRRWIS